MNTLIHVLGSDIPHHNKTILKFFNNTLSKSSIHARKFMIVNSDKKQNSIDYPELKIECWPTKFALAKAVIKKALVNLRQRFFFHGQFNVTLWLALLNGSIKSNQFNWHIWGADLYETSYNLKFRLFYPIRRIAQRRVGCVFATRGDLNYFAQRYPNIRRELLYFPTRMGQLLTDSEKIHKEKLTILIGNSGDRSNKHISALKTIHHQFGNTVNIIIPMGYPSNNEAYINLIRKIGYSLFDTKNLQILTKKLKFNDYLSLIKKCDLGYFIFERQQGVGTLCLFIQYGIPCVLHRKNLFWQDMADQHIPVLFTTDILNKEIVYRTQRQLKKINKNAINFFNCITLWYQALLISSGEKI